MTRKHIVFVLTDIRYAITHRFSLLSSLSNAGFIVVVVAPHHSPSVDQLQNAGIQHIHWAIRRGSINPCAVIFETWRLIKIYVALKPYLIHHLDLKPVLLGSIAARVSRAPYVIDSFNGLGFAFTNGQRRWGRLMARCGMRLLRLATRHNFSVFQNRDDQADCVDNYLATHQNSIVVSGGSGVDLGKFYPAAELPINNVIVIPTRLLYDKGIAEAVAASQLIRARGYKITMLLAGSIDPENPACIPSSTIQAWSQSGAIEWLGHVSDMASLLRRSMIACLPSYREGTPKALLEAASCGLPIVTTNVPGCREVVIDGVNGYLVPSKDAPSLANRIITLITAPHIAKAMGRESRRLAQRCFSTKRVSSAMINAYAACVRMKADNE